MKYKLPLVFILIFILFSCKNENEGRVVENEKQLKKNEIIFSNINKGWVFYDTPINNTADSTLATWNELRLFLQELAQKPKKSIRAFQQKSKLLSKRAISLNDNLPYQFQKPQIKSRISTLITKVRMLDLFLHLDNIPDKKVVLLVSEINIELVSLQRQMDKIVEKSKIPVEEGEADLIRMMDSTRAIPNTTLNNNSLKVE